MATMAEATGSSASWGRNPPGMRSRSMLDPSELTRRSRRMFRQSAWRAKTQNPISLRCTGARSRSSA